MGNREKYGVNNGKGVKIPKNRQKMPFFGDFGKNFTWGVTYYDIPSVLVALTKKPNPPFLFFGYLF